MWNPWPQTGQGPLSAPNLIKLYKVSPGQKLGWFKQIEAGGGTFLWQKVSFPLGLLGHFSVSL